MKHFFAQCIGLVVVMTTIAVLVFVPARAATPDPACNNDFFGIPSWFNGLVGQGDNGCEFTPITYDDNGTQKTDFMKTGAKVILNVLQAAIVIAGYTTIGFVVRGGFGYITSAGSPDGMAAAKKTITNALIGLILALLAASIVNAIGGALR